MTEETPTHWSELIDRAQSGGPDAPAAARTLLEAFIGGSRNRRLGEYIGRCLNDYLRGGVPIEFALHLSALVPPVVRGAGGEGDRRRAQRPQRSTEPGSHHAGSRRHPDRRPPHGGRGSKRPAAADKGAVEKRSAGRGGRRRKADLPPASDGE